MNAPDNIVTDLYFKLAIEDFAHIPAENTLPLASEESSQKADSNLSFQPTNTP